MRRILVVMLVVCGVALLTAAPSVPGGPVAAADGGTAAAATTEAQNQAASANNGPEAFVVSHEALISASTAVLNHGETYPVPLAIGPTGELAGVRVRARAEFRERGRIAPGIDSQILTVHYSEPQPAVPAPVIEIDSGKLAPPGIDSGARRIALAGEYYDFDVMAGVLRPDAGPTDRFGLAATPVERQTDRVRVLLVRRLAALPDSMLQLDTLAPYPMEPVEVQVDSCGELERAPGNRHVYLKVQDIHLGIYLPGGGVVPDEPSSGLDPCPGPRSIDFGARRSRTPPYRSGDFFTPSQDWRDVEKRWLDELRQRGLVNQQSYFGLPAVLSEHEKVLHSANDSTLWRQPIGFFRADLTADRSAVLASRPVEALLPDLEGALTLVPEPDGAYYDREDPPRIAVDLESVPLAASPLLSEVLEFRLAWIGRGGVPNYVDAFTRKSLEARYELVEQHGGVLDLDPQALRPGRYEARIVLGDYVLDRIAFDLGGTGSWVVPYEPREPLVEFDDVTVSVAADAVRVLGAPIAIRVSDAEGQPFEIEPLGVQLYRKGHYTYDCAWRGGSYVGPVALVDEMGKTVLPAPPEPADYEIHVLRPYGWSRAHLARLPAGQQPRAVGIDFLSRGGGGSYVELLGRGEVAVIAPALPGAIAMGGDRSFTVLQPIPVRFDVPANDSVSHLYRLELWLAGGRFPGGAAMRPTRIDDRLRFLHLVERDAEAELNRSLDNTERAWGKHSVTGPDSSELSLLYPAHYELRLLDVTAGYYVDRAAFQVFDPEGPPMPMTEPGGRRATDWPTRDDPLRGLEAWLKPPVWCENPVFPEPPVLRVVQHIGGDTGTLEDNAFVPVEAVFPGHPYFVEAEFETAPPDDLYRVDVGPSEAFLVERTDNPRVYRSGVLNVLPEGR